MSILPGDETLDLHYDLYRRDNHRREETEARTAKKSKDTETQEKHNSHHFVGL